MAHGEATRGPEPVSQTRRLFPPAHRALAAHSSSTCQTARELAGLVLVTAFFLCLASLHPALSSSPENPITFFRVRAPWLPYGLGSRSRWEKGVTRNQHCQHFAPSLVQARVIFPPPQPLALLAYRRHPARWLLETCCQGDTPPPERAVTPGQGRPRAS